MYNFLAVKDEGIKELKKITFRQQLEMRYQYDHGLREENKKKSVLDSHKIRGIRNT